MAQTEAMAVILAKGSTLLSARLSEEAPYLSDIKGNQLVLGLIRPDGHTTMQSLNDVLSSLRHANWRVLSLAEQALPEILTGQYAGDSEPEAE